jgi:hypothetical protein
MRSSYIGHCRFGLFVMILAGSNSAVAGSISPGIWYEFGFDPNHAPVAAGCQPNDPGGVPCRAGIGTVNLDAPPWTFTSSTPVALEITDGLLSGDFFDVDDFGTLVGSTPAVPLGVGFCGLDPLICWVDPAMSHASLLLPPGPHSITVLVHPAQILGEGFFEFTAVPEPSSILLIAAGLAGYGCRRRKL